MNVVQIREANALALTNEQIANSISDAVKWIREGDYEEVGNVVMLIEYGNGQLARLTFGKPIDHARVVGLLSIMAARMAASE